MDDVTDLVLTPFREIVEKGSLALENAGETQPMAKAAQGLVREGERALKKIEPICKKLLDDYGTNFINALKDNGTFFCSHLAAVLRPADAEARIFFLTRRQMSSATIAPN